MAKRKSNQKTRSKQAKVPAIAKEGLKKDTRFAVLIQRVSEDCSKIEQINLVTKERRTFPLPCTLDREKLLKEKLNRPREFARGRRCQAFLDEEMTFHKVDWDRVVQVGRAYVQAAEKFPRVALGIDLSTKKRPGNAIAGGRQDEDAGRLYVTEMQLLQAPAPDVAQYAADRWKILGAEAVVVENNAYQDSFEDWASEMLEEPVPWLAHTTGSNKANLESGIPGMAGALEAGGIIFVVDDWPDSCAKQLCEHENGLCKLIRDLKAHPFGATDSVMALWFLWRYFHTNTGSGLGFGEEEERPTRSRGEALYSARRNVGRHRGDRRRLI